MFFTPYRFIYLFILFLFSSVTQAEPIKVLLFNTWGVPLVTWDKHRYSQAMAAIADQNPDIVILTEVFTRKGNHSFRHPNYPHIARGGGFAPRLTGSGLRILSKYPFEEHAILTYSACKKEDCLSRKGALLVTVLLPSGKKLNVVGTHLNSAGGESTRIAQLNQLDIFTKGYEDTTAPTLVAGDFNFNPFSNEYDHLKRNQNIQDAWQDTQNSDQPGYTYNCYENSYARDYAIKTRSPLFKDRIDYLFYRGAIRPLKTQIIFNDADQIFSDHYALMGTFDL